MLVHGPVQSLFMYLCHALRLLYISSPTREWCPDHRDFVYLALQHSIQRVGGSSLHSLISPLAVPIKIWHNCFTLLLLLLLFLTKQSGIKKQHETTYCREGDVLSHFCVFSTDRDSFLLAIQSKIPSAPC